VFDFESPSISVTKGPDVAGCVAGALVDLLDGANEAFDSVDGTSTPGRVLEAVASLSVAPTAETFWRAWADAGFHDGDPARVLVAHKVLADDAFEPNDQASEAAPLGAVGLVRHGLLLNRFSEDWW